MTAWLLTAQWTAIGLWGSAGVASVTAMSRLGPDPTWDRIARALLWAGVLALAVVLVALWQVLDRPPLRTLGETRLWYAMLLVSLGLAIEWRGRTRILRLPMVGFGLVFLAVNVLRPETLDQTLMPALQSPWFIPHVLVYMTGYAALGLSCGVAIWSLGRCHWLRRDPVESELELPLWLVKLGIVGLTAGLVIGAIWAKEAWGHYWSWDPKVTWAFLSWAGYLAVLHLAQSRIAKPSGLLWLIAVAFLGVLGCWFLVNVLPAADSSIHSYTE